MKKRTISQNAKRSRTKGHDFEREVARRLRLVYPGARRHLEYQDGQAFGVDLAETGSLRVQCKKLAKYASVATIHEARFDPLFGEIPVLVTAGDNEPPMAVVPFEDFVRLLASSAIR